MYVTYLVFPNSSKKIQEVVHQLCGFAVSQNVTVSGDKGKCDTGRVRGTIAPARYLEVETLVKMLWIRLLRKKYTRMKFD